MRSNWRKLRALGSADRWLLLQALSLTIAIRVGLRVLPFTTVRRYLDRWADRGGRTAGRQAGCASDVKLGTTETGHIVWAVRAAGSRVPGSTCLMEALAADTLLHRYGHSPALKIGVRRGTLMTLDAHAWVECGGKIVIGTTPSLTEYAELSQLS